MPVCKRCLTYKEDGAFECKANGKINSKTCRDCRSQLVKEKRRRGELRKPVRHPAYHSWQSMIRRCESPSVKNHELYGGRGITVCQRWRNSFAAFMEDMGPKPSLKHTIERIDSDGHYEPGNCRWATYKEQANNRRNNRRLTFQGLTMTMAQWAEQIGITIYALYQRLARGKMTLEEALTFRQPLIEHDGRRLSASEWARILPIRACTISKRIEKGWTPEEALTTPVRSWGRPSKPHHLTVKEPDAE